MRKSGIRNQLRRDASDIAGGGMISQEVIDCANLAKGSVLDIETRSRHYRIECLGGDSIHISGHPEYCPEPVAASLQGAVDKHGEVTSGLIVRGKPLRFVLSDRRPITTTRVMHLRVDSQDRIQ